MGVNHRTGQRQGRATAVSGERGRARNRRRGPTRELQWHRCWRVVVSCVWVGVGVMADLVRSGPDTFAMVW